MRKKRPLEGWRDNNNLGEEEQDEDWKFYLKQESDRLKVHWTESRLTPFDLLACNTFEECDFITGKCPVELLESCSVEDSPSSPYSSTSLKFIKESVERIMSFERKSEVREYWNEILNYTSHLQQVHFNNQLACPDTIKEEIEVMLKGKSFSQLQTLEGQVRIKLQSSDADPDYWNALLSQITFYKSKAHLIELAERIKQRKSDLLKERGVDCIELVYPNGNEVTLENKEKDDLINWDKSEKTCTLYAAISSRNIRHVHLPFNEDIPHNTTYSWFNEVGYTVKPRFHNICFRRIEWNKYNQAHYSSKNPPPPTIHGFEFNIIYTLPLPDAEPGQYRSPYYKAERDSLEPDKYQIIRFIGGAPYEDLLFRIPAKEWELSYKMGFVCRFEGGILRLSFRYKRLVYRR